MRGKWSNVDVGSRGPCFAPGCHACTSLIPQRQKNSTRHRSATQSIISVKCAFVHCFPPSYARSHYYCLPCACARHATRLLQRVLDTDVCQLKYASSLRHSCPSLLYYMTRESSISLLILYHRHLRKYTYSFSELPSAIDV